jgi:ABC-type cobalamin/Fe3+-siderophores transport system ATPase subunit
VIAKLTVTRFGKFASRTFPLGSATFFTGGNETGKTTLFDALFDALCRPSGTTTHGKRLKSRYGDERRAEVSPADTGFSPDPDEFINIHAIRSGDMDVDFAQGAKWTDKIKASLFSGGVDPKRIRVELEAEASTRGGTRQMRNRKQKTDELAKAQEEKLELETRRAQVLAAELETIASAETLDAVDKAIAQDKRKVEELERILAQQKAIREQEEGKAVLAFLAETDELASGLAELPQADKARDETDLAALEKAVQDVRGKLERAQGAQENAEKDCRDQGDKVLRLEKAVLEQAPLATLSARLLAELNTLTHTRAASAAVVWNPLMLVLASVAIAAGVISGILVDNTTVRILLAAIGVFAGAALAVFARKTIMKEDTARMAAETRRIRDEWRTVAGEARALRAETTEVLAGELHRMEVERDAASARVSEEKGELGRRERLLGELHAQIAALQAAQAQAIAALEEWLAQRGTRSAADYRTKVRDQASREERLKQRVAQQAGLLEKWKCADAASLKSECISRIEILDRTITDSRLPDPDVKLKENEKNSLRGDLESQEARRARLLEAVSEGRGVVKGSLADIPERIVQAERHILDCEQEIADLELVRQASARAAEMFAEIERDAGAVFFGLTRDIGALFGEILPETREIAIGDLDGGSIKVNDAGGAARPLDDLSQGTRDSFLFAARLALSVRAAPEGGLLLLDEPFLSLDADREERALRMLGNFQEKNGRQIIIFGKEKSLTDRLRKLFPDLVVHDLGA